MAFTNLPPNLKDMFYSLGDRIAKLETGPNQAMYQADIAYSVATEAQVQAINAGIQANQAASQATIAQSQATIASTQATTALNTANGKNKVTYSTSAPGATANTVGDIWYQYGTASPYTNKVIAQWSGAGGTSWTPVTVSGLVIANIDAGAITTGTLSAITISAGSGANSFNVSSTGTLSAQGAYIKGNITADSGTFNGSIYSASGYFGTSPNTWSIGSSGLTGAGTATITGGAINGSTITTTSGQIGGWYLGTNYLSSVSGGTGFRMNSSTGAAAFGTLSASGTLTASAGLVLSTGTSTVSAGGNDFNNCGAIGASSISTSGSISAGTTLVSTSAATATTTAATNCYITTGGTITKTTNTSSQRYKENITNIVDVPELDPKLLLQLPVRAYTYKDGHLPDSDDRAGQLLPGFIAEELDAIYPVAVDYENGNIETWNSFWIVPALLALIQDQEKRITILENQLSQQ